MHLMDIARFFRLVGGAVAAAALLTGAAAGQSAAPDVAGVWIDHTGQGAVEIAPCAGPGGDRICGRVVWLKNPDHKSVTGKRICGTQVLGNLRREAADAWEAGWIYNPEDEERFSASLQLADADTLLVTGYLGVKFLGETFTWRRATTSLDRCPAGAAAGTSASTH
jgi:uncharacterized protein (DUF2147 family)